VGGNGENEIPIAIIGSSITLLNLQGPGMSGVSCASKEV